MKAAALAAALLTASVALPAAAQSWGYPDQARTYSSYGRYGNDYNGQQDRPGDYRCDAYWDAARTDCGAAWRDQRPAHTRRYRPAGYGYSYSSGPGVYPGAYGRPDLVYPGGGSAYDRPAYGRDARRVDWCRSVYRSYDPASGYYRTYDGRLVFCG